MNKQELLRRIYFERITDVAELPETDRAMVAGDEELAAVIARNRDLAPLGHTTPPDRAGALAESYRRAAEKSSETGLPGHHGWIPRLALVLVAVVVASAAVLLVHNRHGTDDNAPVWQAGTTAWAATGGYIIEYELNPSGVNEWGRLDFPIDRLDEVVKTWLSENGLTAAGPGGRPLVLVNADFRDRDNPPETLKLRVDFVQLDEGRRDDLVAYIEAETGYVPLKITEREFYYSEKYPDICTPQRTITIAGNDYLFPYDFTDHEIQRLVWKYLRGYHCAYSGHAGFGLNRRFGDCDVYKYETMPDGRLVFSVAADHLDLVDDVRRMLRTSSIEYEPHCDGLILTTLDPVLELVHLCEQQVYLDEHRSVELPKYTIIWRLVPEEVTERISDESIRMAVELFDRIRTHSAEEEELIAEITRIFRESSESSGRPVDEQKLEYAVKLQVLSRLYSEAEREMQKGEEYHALRPSADILADAEALQDRLEAIVSKWYADNVEEFYASHAYAQFELWSYEGGFYPQFSIHLVTDDRAYLDDLVDHLSAGTGSSDYTISDKKFKCWIENPDLKPAPPPKTDAEDTVGDDRDAQPEPTGQD